MAKRSTFWDDHARNMEDSEYRHHFVLQSARIAAIDELVNRLDELRVAQGMSKATLARAIERDPASVRRLLTAQQINPTLSMVADLAAALGYRLSLEPLDDDARAEVTETLRELVRS
jgi:ribosome-binding protein aMBF1 (putative translation factor)